MILIAYRLLVLTSKAALTVANLPLKLMKLQKIAFLLLTVQVSCISDISWFAVHPGVHWRWHSWSLSTNVVSCMLSRLDARSWSRWSEITSDLWACWLWRRTPLWSSQKSFSGYSLCLLNRLEEVSDPSDSPSSSLVFASTPVQALPFSTSR